MDIQQSMVGAACVLKPGASLSEADAAQFRTAAEEASRKCSGRVLLDASTIAFVDSAGLEALMDVTERLHQAGRSLKICGATPTFRNVLRLTGCAGSFEFFDEVNSGVRSLL